MLTSCIAERGSTATEGRRMDAARRSGKRVFGAAAAIVMALLAAPAVCFGSAEGIDPQQVMRAYREIDGWVRAWEAPEAEALLDPRHASGVCVTLRLGGAVIGRSTVVRGAGPDDGTMVWRAAREAMAEATGRLPVERDALERERRVEQAARVMIDVQVAGPMVRIGGASFEEAALGLTPGLDGIAARVEGKIEAIFPGTMLASNLTPAQALTAVVNGLELAIVGGDSARVGVGDPRVSIGQLQRTHGLALYRFRAQHVAQTAPGEPPVFLHRGGAIVALSDVRADGLRALGERVVAHALTHRWPGEEAFGLMGTYRPWVGDYEAPLVAPPSEQALAIFAMARFIGLESVQHDPRQDEWRAALRELLNALAVVDASETDPADSIASAALARLALIEAHDAWAFGAPGAGAEIPDECMALFRRCSERLQAWVEAGEDREEVGDAERAVIAYSFSAAAPEGFLPEGEAGLAEQGRAMVRRLFRETPPGRVVNLMPWLGWAEVRLAGAGEIPAEIALRDARSLVWRHQLTFDDAAGLEPDLIGGIVFTAARQPLPSWQSLRPLAFLATMLGDDRLTSEDEAGREAIRLLTSLRFMMQLEAGEEAMHMFRDRGRSLGGIRLAPWDQRLTLDASALALLTIAESLEAVERRGAGE
ncbi:MAG: hypothetical protein VYC34_00385 [Planctomycetota bacterium]|nr:hypothetical protein [Planctomycetota bacterium]